MTAGASARAHAARIQARHRARIAAKAATVGALGAAAGGLLSGSVSWALAVGAAFHLGGESPIPALLRRGPFPPRPERRGIHGGIPMTEADSLVAFLRARLDDDEQTARRACEYAEADWRLDEDGETVLWWPPEPHVAEAERRHGLPVVSDQWRGQTIGKHIAPHIARHNPRRVLDEVAAKRSTIRLYELSVESAETAKEPGQEAMRELYVMGAESYLNVLRRDAAVWRDHPDYDPSWAPDAE